MSKTLNRFSAVAAATCTTLGLAAGQAQEPIPFPGVLLEQGDLPEVLEFETDTAILDLLVGRDKVVLQGIPMPVGYSANLELESVDFQWSSLGIYVDGERADYDRGDLTLWKGTVQGVDNSEVYLAFSSHGSYGWIHDGVDYTHVSSFPGADGEWSSARIRLYSDRALQAAGSAQNAPGNMVPCISEKVNGAPTGGPVINPADVSPPTYGGATKLECKMAIETDRQFYGIWNNLVACENYAFALLGAVSDRYDTQVDTVLTYPYVQFWTTVNDPWNSQDNGGGCGDVLNEFVNAWAGNIPNGAKLAHMFSGANLGCGVAYLDVLCNQNNGFAVSGNLNGGVKDRTPGTSSSWPTRPATTSVLLTPTTTARPSTSATTTARATPSARTKAP